MSVKRDTIRYGAAAVALAIVIIAGSAFIANSSILAGQGAPQASSLLVIQLTDPPHVPVGTSSLNMTYTSLALLVGEPASGGKINPTTVKVTPSGGSATLDLLKLQNVSQTIGSTSIPDGSVFYTVTFTVSSIKIDVNGSISSVALVSGGSDFTVTLSNRPALHGTNLALLQLNPTVVNSPTGYQLIPSSVGILKPSQGQGEDKVGFQHDLNDQDNNELRHAQGNVSATFVSLSVSGNVTSIKIQVNNTGSSNVTLNAIGIHGNFTAQGGSCPSWGSDSRDHNQQDCGWGDVQNQVVFVPVVPDSTTTTTSSTTSTTTSTSTGPKACLPVKLTLVNGDNGGDNGDGPHGLVLSPGECVNLSFSGVISFGHSPALIPSTLKGQDYIVHVIASGGANMKLDCVLPLGANACKAASPQHQD